MKVENHLLANTNTTVGQGFDCIDYHLSTLSKSVLAACQKRQHMILSVFQFIISYQERASVYMRRYKLVFSGFVSFITSHFAE